MKKVFVYIDGFNVYHNLKNYIKSNNLDDTLKWLNIKEVVNFFIEKKTETIEKISFFSAIPKKNQFGEEKKKKHKLYYKALESANINIVNGRFANKTKKYYCSNCSKKNIISSYEEKKTDVSLAIAIISDVLTLKDLDKIILVSADTDFIPVVEYILNNTNKEITVLFPLGHKHSTEFDNIPNERYKTKEIKLFHITKSLFPDEVEYNNQIYKNPYKTN